MDQRHEELQAREEIHQITIQESVQNALDECIKNDPPCIPAPVQEAKAVPIAPLVVGSGPQASSGSQTAHSPQSAIKMTYDRSSRYGLDSSVFVSCLFTRLSRIQFKP